MSTTTTFTTTSTLKVHLWLRRNRNDKQDHDTLGRTLTYLIGLYVLAVLSLFGFAMWVVHRRARRRAAEEENAVSSVEGAMSPEMTAADTLSRDSRTIGVADAESRMLQAPAPAYTTRASQVRPMSELPPPPAYNHPNHHIGRAV